MATPKHIIELESVSRRYGQGDREVWALREVTLAVQAGEFVSLMGPSGSGKSTLLNLVAGLDRPTTGEVFVAGAAITRASENEMARMRRRTVAFIFQFFNLLPSLTAAQNVAVPLRADARPTREVRERVAAALAKVGLEGRAEHYPSELSGGEMQRVAIARALATEAPILLADEPTGNLDSRRSEDILELLRSARERDGRSILLVTHDVRAAAYGDRLITLRDGVIVDELESDAGTASVVPLRRSRDRE